MAAHANLINKAATVAALDVEFVKNFRGEFDRLVETLGLFNIDTVAAGTALYQYVISGTLLDGSTADGTSGTSYTEGDFIARSKFTVTKTPIGEVEFVPYAKETSAQAILKGGFENAVARTDKKAVQQMRAAILAKFFGFLGNGTTKAAPESGTWNLQQMLAYTEAKLLDALESKNDEGGAIVHFVNRQDAYGYLANATITMQDVFGLTYLQNFLGVENVMLTNKVQSGTCFATPADNIHIYGIDFATLADTGLAYASDELGLCGVAHKEDYDRASATTYLVRSCNLIPEYTDYIAIGSTAPIASTTTTTTTGA